MMLIAILFRLGVQLRAREIGVLEAVGFRYRKILNLLATEGLIVAMAGAAIGVVAGVGYAWLMLAGLRTWWLAAVVTPFVNLYWTPQSLVVGYASGVLVALVSMVWSLRRLRRLSPRALLAGESEEPPTFSRRRSWGRRGGVGVSRRRCRRWASWFWPQRRSPKPARFSPRAPRRSPGCSPACGGNCGVFRAAINSPLAPFRWLDLRPATAAEIPAAVL